MTIRKLLAYVLATIALVFEGFFGILPFIGFVMEVVTISCAIFLFIAIFRKKYLHSWRTTLYQYILTVLATIGFFTSIFLTFITYHNQVPGVISEITLTNSGQTVVFIQMSHIATPEFFVEKQQTIKALSESGYTILFEGVKPGTPENQEKFNQSIKFKFTPTLYDSFADLIGMTAQDNKKLFANVATGSLISVDLSIDEIVELMGTGSIKTTTGSLMDIEPELLAIIPSISNREGVFIGWMFRGILNWTLKQTQDISTAIYPPEQSRLFETIIDRRNDRIVEYITTHPKDKIAVVYGALHFNGVYESLQKIDKNWNTTHIKTSTPYN